jgi:hypothetical protein
MRGENLRVLRKKEGDRSDGQVGECGRGPAGETERIKEGSNGAYH